MGSETIKQLIERIESIGMLRCESHKGYIKLNDKQWELIKSECSLEETNGN